MTEPKVIRLPRNGPKPGQSMRSWLQGKAQGDRQWQRLVSQSITKLAFARFLAAKPKTGA